jgi:hypothetical protein
MFYVPVYYVLQPLMGGTLTLILLMWRIGWAPNSIPIYIQQDAKFYSLFISGNCSTCFGWHLLPSSGGHTTASTASGICHTVTAICRYRGRVGTGLSVLWVAYATGYSPRILEAVRSKRYSLPQSKYIIYFNRNNIWANIRVSFIFSNKLPGLN